MSPNRVILHLNRAGLRSSRWHSILPPQTSARHDCSFLLHTRRDNLRRIARRSFVVSSTPEIRLTFASTSVAGSVVPCPFYHSAPPACPYPSASPVRSCPLSVHTDIVPLRDRLSLCLLALDGCRLFRSIYPSLSACSLSSASALRGCSCPPPCPSVSAQSHSVPEQYYMLCGPQAVPLPLLTVHIHSNVSQDNHLSSVSVRRHTRVV